MKGISIVLVEDDPKFRTAFEAAIAATHDLLLLGSAATGKEGLELLVEHRPDVLLIDLGLPDRPGLDLIRFATEHLSDCDSMVITVFGDERHVIESIEAGASGYLLKDALPSDMAEQIRMLHAGASPISPVIARQILSRFRASRLAPTADSRDPVPALSEREAEVLALAAKGFTFDETARLLVVSPHTVMTYVKRIYRKLQVSSKSEAVYEARKMGLLRD